MKIIVISLNYYPEEVGCGKFTKEIVDWISKKAKKVIVVTTNPFILNGNANLIDIKNL